MNIREFFSREYAAPSSEVIYVISDGVLCQSQVKDFGSSSIEDVTKETFEW